MTAESAGGHVWEEDQVSDDLMCTRCAMHAGQYRDQVCPGTPTEWDDQDPATPVSPELFHLDLGLRAFSQEARCSKCGNTGCKVVWHVMPIIGNIPTFPCEDWLNQGLLTGQVGEHLCRTCTFCGYGWPERTFGS